MVMEQFLTIILIVVMSVFVGMVVIAGILAVSILVFDFIRIIIEEFL